MLMRIWQEKCFNNRIIIVININSVMLYLTKKIWKKKKRFFRFGFMLVFFLSFNQQRFIVYFVFPSFLNLLINTFIEWTIVIWMTWFYRAKSTRRWAMCRLFGFGHRLPLRCGKLQWLVRLIIPVISDYIYI